MIRMIVFDMAGTTVDENNVVYKTLQHAINEANFDFSLDDVLEAAAGKEKLEAIRSVLNIRGIADEQLAGQIYQRFLKMLDQAYKTQQICEKPNATKLFHWLKDREILVVLNTGYNRATAEALVEKIGWAIGAEYDLLVTASDVVNNRPSPDMILYAMQHFGMEDPAEVIKVGDSTVDVMEGRNAGCGINVGITTGAHTASQLLMADPEYIVHNLIELITIIEPENHAVAG